MKQTQKTLVASITALLLCSTSTAANADWWEDISLAGFANTTYRHTVIIPFITEVKSRSYAAASIRFGGNPPLALLGRSLL